jgi:hypothetical protein
VVILEVDELPTVKSRETILASFEMRDPLEFTLSPQPIIELISRTSATFEIDLVSSLADLFVSGPLVQKVLFSLSWHHLLAAIPLVVR